MHFENVNAIGEPAIRGSFQIFGCGLLHAFERNLVVRGLAVEKDRKSTRLNSSHVEISYAVFCLKKKKKDNKQLRHGHAIPRTFTAQVEAPRHQQDRKT